MVLYTFTFEDNANHVFTTTSQVEVKKLESPIVGETVKLPFEDKKDGRIILNPSGSYTYKWNDGTTSFVRLDLDSAKYVVTITASTGCTIVKSWNLERQYEPVKYNYSGLTNPN